MDEVGRSSQSSGDVYSVADGPTPVETEGTWMKVSVTEGERWKSVPSLRMSEQADVLPPTANVKKRKGSCEVPAILATALYHPLQKCFRYWRALTLVNRAQSTQHEQTSDGGIVVTSGPT